MPEWAFPLALSFVGNALVTWGVVRTEMRYWRAAINAAHARLDLIKAPNSARDWLPN